MKATELRQGFFFSAEVKDKIIEASVDLKPRNKENSVIIIVSQDCDIVNNTSKEPFVEFIYGRIIEGEPNGNFINGKNPRTLHIKISSTTYEFVIHDRFRVYKKNIEEINNDETYNKLQSDNLDILKKWIAKRYTRAAFPDEFNKRLKDNHIDKQIVKTEISKGVSCVLIDIPEEEYPPGRAYEPHIIVVTPEPIEEEKENQIREVYEKGFFFENKIYPDIKILPEDDITIKILRRYKRWDMDFYSLSEGEQPAEGVDQI